MSVLKLLTDQCRLLNRAISDLVASSCSCIVLCHLHLRLSSESSKSHFHTNSSFTHDIIDNTLEINSKVDPAEHPLIEVNQLLFLVEVWPLSELLEKVLVLRKLSSISVVGNCLRHWVSVELTLLVSSQAVRGKLRIRRCLNLKEN